MGDVTPLNWRERLKDDVDDWPEVMDEYEEEVERLREALAAANRAVSEAGIINPGEPLASRIWTLMVQRDMAREVLNG